MLNEHINEAPLSLNVDFEKAVFSAKKEVWENCLPYGCFFHLSQSFLRKVQSRFIKVYKDDPEFRKIYRQMQALAYLPGKDVVSDFY